MSLLESFRRGSNNPNPCRLSRIQGTHMCMVCSFKTLPKGILDTLLDVLLSVTSFLHISPAVKGI